ncbi:MAG: galactokinase [Candidatus Nanopelagicales bacterium]
MRNIDDAVAAFEQSFGPGGDVRVFFAPGRVNLIGDHIDYSGGLVLPMAIDRGTVLVARSRPDTVVRAVSLDLGGMVDADVADTSFDPVHGWFSYVLGMLDVLGAEGYRLSHGADLLVSGDIPNGAGLSSSASLELAAGVAFDALGGFGLDATTLALAGQRDENDYIGVSCGIMDQLAVARGRRGCALLMDCATLDVEYVPFPHDRATLIVANSNHRRELADSAYNARRAAVERAAAVLGRERLVDADVAEVEGAAGLTDEEVRRARHTVTEQARVVAAAAALRAGDLDLFGDLMRESHASLRDDFEVTGPQLDALAEAAWAQPGTIGARMTGAGFGGCAVVLARPGAEAAVIEGINRDYEAATGVPPTCMVMTSGEGAREVAA